MVAKEVPAYEPQTIEPKWQKIWLERGQYVTRERPDRQKFYLLEMLPYPSGDLHVGHARNYTLGDVIARYRRMRGLNVLHPMGWDAFGLPAEQAAIARGLHPREWTNANITNMRSQLRRLGTSYDWTREIDTSSPEYYRWTQWLFLLMFRKGLAYKAEATLNWCPNDQTVLANEQAEGGVCWRCGCKVERRKFNQWFFRITQYADKLLEGLDRLDAWPERVKTMQRNWIGRSEGVTVAFSIEGGLGKIDVFTTRVDTIFGATYLAIAPEHPLLSRIIQGRPEADAVTAFAASVKDKSELDRTQLMEKQGVFTGVFAKNPLSGERIPIWVTNYVLAEYGTGAVMGVPAHDQRDFEFARAHELQIRTVVKPATPSSAPSPSRLPAAFVDDGVLVNSGEFTDLRSADARKAMTQKVVRAQLGTASINYKLRDWLISRERYWGAPVPMVLCPRDRYVPVPLDQLPVRLPDNAPLTGTQGSPLAQVPVFMKTTCPKCGGPATREPETMDTFMCSSWYFLRYLDPHNTKEPWSVDLARYWAPVDHYIGGIEHAVLHLMYARFFYKVLAEERLVPGDEPFIHLFNQGMVLGENHEKMSKSRGNTIGIDEAVETYGADALRLFELFAGPPESDFPWSTTGIAGCTRMLQRVWRLVLGNVAALERDRQRANEPPGALTPDEAALRLSVHQKIAKIGEELSDRMHFNTSVAHIMTLLNDVEDFAAKNPEADSSVALGEALRTLLLLLAPFAPHITEELWQRTGFAGSVHDEAWPAFDAAAVQRDTVTIVAQVNGRMRGTFEAPLGVDENGALELAKKLETVAAQLDGKAIRKLIFVKDKLLNIVAG
ncbi:MAG TPA: leucine--tRNA ligase [Candidatus Acidoferrales bacterium]|nr:leucine--tRNA ligase [Candidatus Acidoferrales bacterium]